MMKKLFFIFISIWLVAQVIMAAPEPAFSGDDPKQKESGRPPSPVVVTKVTRGILAPHGNFTGTIFFHEVTDLSSETSGRVDATLFEEGEEVKRGQILLRVNAEILKKRIAETIGSYEETGVNLEKAGLDLKRIEKLFSHDSIAEQTFDDYRYKVKGLEKKHGALKNQVERLEVELTKKEIRAPFDGHVIKKFSNVGEWVDPGVKVATIAEKDIFDVVADVPERILPFVSKNMKVRVSSGGKILEGRVFAIIAAGDISTRTFPVKVRVNTDTPLLEGMEAKVSLPSGKSVSSFIVPRDALVSAFGREAIFVVSDSKAVMIPVKVTGYSGLNVGILGKDIREGMDVVIKGNERLRPGQSVRVPKKRAPITGKGN